MRNRSITKQDVKFIVENWNSMSLLEISEKLGLNSHQVRRIVRELRKNGFNLPKKVSQKTSLKQFIDELKKGVEE